MELIASFQTGFFWQTVLPRAANAAAADAAALPSGDKQVPSDRDMDSGMVPKGLTERHFSQ
ncbi:hypothetical protein CUJ84_pRLN1000531 (plasmid) [Rhizobium leguminosarum]|uniref:Uncharacterized protein n=1 Tax=Rhizobium leguminosarum TaxID=384 RepID=A0A2K9ZCM1_RHILE|nr:hypothetical protein CUJ84_pRLN1000531 [Rhizobium leguminosarum]